MGSLTWNGSSGDWSTGPNWSVVSGPDPTPGAADDVTINAPGTYTLTVSGSQSVNNLTLDDPGATVAVVGSVIGRSGTLTVNGTITGGGGTIDLTQGGLAFANSESIDNLTIGFISPITSIAVPITLSNGAVLTLGPNVVVQGSSNSTPIAFLVQGGALVNEGTIITPPSIFTTVLEGGGLDNEGSISIGHGFTVNGDLTNNGQISFAGSPLSSLKVNGNLSGLGKILLPDSAGISGATLSVTGTIAAQQIIWPHDGLFTVAARAIDSQALIENFTVGNSIDLTGLTYSTSLQATFTGNAGLGTVLITDGNTVVASLKFVGIPSGSVFHVTPDASTGTVITSDVPVVPCLVTGTRIRTERGEIPVEQLRLGDRVPAVRAGRPLPVVWIGHRRVLAARHPQPEEVWPVRVAAGAFADGIPHRDLWLSPEHCVFQHGVLVPIRALINGTSIVQVPCPEVTYWHVELESHDLMLCEGAWTESYLDMGNRAAFEPTGDASAPDFSRQAWEARACQQQERGGPVVAAIRAVIDARARKAA